MSTPRAVLTIAILAVALPCPAQQKAKREVIQTSVTTRDGWSIPLTYYRTADDREAPVVLLVQGEGANRQTWTPLATTLHGAGYAVVAFDRRKSGEARFTGPGRVADRTTPADYRAMLMYDFESVKDFLHDEHQAGRLNIRKTGVVAAGGGTPLGIAFAVNDWMRPPMNDAPVLAARTPRGQDVRSIAVLTPEAGVPGVTVGAAVRKLALPPAKVSFWFGVGGRDRGDVRTAEAFHQQAAGGKTPPAEPVPGAQAQKIETFSGVAQRGTDLLQPQVDRRWNVTAGVVAFFDLTLKSLPETWVDRAGRR